MIVTNAVEYIHSLLKQSVAPGDVVIDATVGNGWDTELMSNLVGVDGTVYGFDIQQVAIDVTKVRLKNCPNNSTLFLASHSEMHAKIDPAHKGRVSAITFNLGYLPGGDKDITTQVDTTHTAIHIGLTLLAAGGLITLVCYRHAHGEEELIAVRNVLVALPQTDFTVWETQFINQVGKPPVVFIVRKTT